MEDESIEFPETQEEFSKASAAEPTDASAQSKMAETEYQQEQWELCSELSDASSFSMISEQTDASWVHVADSHPAENTSYLARLMQNPSKFEACKPLRRQQRVSQQLAKQE